MTRLIDADALLKKLIDQELEMLAVGDTYCAGIICSCAELVDDMATETRVKP